jgi:hypothetical protein
MKFMSIGYYTSGVSNLKYHKGDLSIQHQKKRKKRSKKGGRNILNIPERFTAVSKTCVFGTITLDGRQLFRQYKTFDQYSFISYLGELKRKFHKLILFLDRAPQHCRSKRVRTYLERNNDDS